MVRDLNMIETATFWKDGPEIATGEMRTEDIGTEVFFLPAAAHTEKDGTFTNTQRLLQWHHKAVEPPGDCRSELWFYYELGRRIKARLAGSTDPRDRAIRDLTWDYPVDVQRRAERRRGAPRDQRHRPGRYALPGYTALKADGSTACGCWIYSGVYADEVNQTARRAAGPRAGPRRGGVGLGVADEPPGALQPRLGRSGRAALERAQEAGLVGRRAVDRRRRAGLPSRHRRPTTDPPTDARAAAAIGGNEPFIMQADGRAWLYAPAGLADGPMPTHYEPQESPLPNALYPQHRANPAREEFDRADNQYHPAPGTPGAEVFPYVFTTFRVTEHHTAGGMSRWTPRLNELQPEMFVEVSPTLAAERGADATESGRTWSPRGPRSRAGCWSPSGPFRCGTATG